MANAQPAIQVDGLTVVRGGRTVLRDFSVAVPEGAVTGLLGPNGSGKTTLMRAIVGVQRIAAGELRVLGRPAGTPELRHLVGYVTQAASVYRDITVTENLRYFASITEAPKARVAEVIEEVALSDHANDRVDRLSGGQQARVSLAAALLAQPRLLILDEPTVGLDPVVRDDLWTMFNRLASEGSTLLVSSHVMDEADRCERLLLLRDGHLLADETPAELRERSGSDDLDEAFLRLVRETQEPEGSR